MGDQLKWRALVIVLLVLATAGAGVVMAQVSPNVRIDFATLGMGGGRRASTNVVIEDGLVEGAYPALQAAAPQTFTIAGQVSDSGTPVAGVEISDGLGRTATTGADGRYFLGNLPKGNYVLTAVKTGYTFEENGRSVSLTSNVEANFAATAKDALEVDDTCAAANAIDPDGSVQPHTFHSGTDEDWVRFDAAAGVRYLIEGNIPNSSLADVAIELYAECGLGTLGGQDFTFSPGIRLEYTPTADTPLYLRLTNNAPQFAGPKGAYEISVRATPSALSGNDVAILVAGKVKANDLLQPNIRGVTQQFYNFLLVRGYDADHIQFLADDVGVPNADGLATRANLQDAITNWAKARLAPHAMLTIFLMDHGDREVFYLNKLQDEELRPRDLDAWLTQIESEVSGLKVNVFIEACYSGSFISLPAPDSISKPNRVVIASAAASQLAHASAAGAKFSDQFIPAIFQGSSIYNGFQIARWGTQGTYGDAQSPWLDDDGDGIANEPEDGKVAQKRSFGLGGNIADAFVPYIVAVSPTLNLTQTQVQLTAVVTDDGGVQRVWAAVYAPGYTAGNSSIELLPDSAPTMTLTATGLDTYAVTLSNIKGPGRYRIVVNAEDLNSQLAQPVAIEVQAGWGAYLPVVRR